MNEKKMLQELIDACNEKKNLDLIKKAFYYSLNAHSKQKRLSGEPYFIHPYQTALTLAKWGLKNNAIIAGLLHDLLEDTEVTEKELKKEFGKEITSLVKAVTQIKSKKLAKKTIKRKSLEKTLIATLNKTNAILIKLADKLHNLETIKAMPKKRQLEICKTALNIYSPIAQKLGMNRLKFRIEEICFPIVYPKEYKKIKDFFKKGKQKKLREIRKIIKLLKPKINAVKFKEFEKPNFILFNKTLKKKKQLSEVNDCVILIIVVKTRKECYNTLGIVHKLFKPVPRKFKDYIAIPKNGIYSALHTTIIGPNKKPVKIYIQTREMYETAKIGVLQLLKNKTESKKVSEKIKWLRKIKRKEKELKTDEELSELLGINSIDKNTFVFNEKGKLIELPQESHAIDFFFLNEEQKAPYLKEIEVNKKQASFKQHLNAGDIVKGIYSKKPTINKRWLLLTLNKNVHAIIKKQLKKFEKQQKNEFYLVSIKAKNIPGVLAKITNTLAKYNINIEEIYQERIDRHEGKNMHIYLTINTLETGKIKKAIETLKKIKSIKTIKKKKI